MEGAARRGQKVREQRKKPRVKNTQLHNNLKTYKQNYINIRRI